ncbi:MAG: DUF2007 domain-containing protein [Lachnospiraceae bacterium]|nr:DUF2007 domain-containing protein [Lachnospiraceae bacterium]
MDIKVYNASDEIDAQRVLSLLDSNNIKAYIRDSGPGSFLEITRGFSVYGKDIYVDERDAPDALSLLGINIPDSNHDKTEGFNTPWYHNRRIIAWIILLFMTCVAVLCVVLESLS